MGKRLVSLLTALALAVSAFASLAVAPAGAEVEELGTTLYFPWLPNGDEYGNMGPWYSTFTVQNPNGFPLTVTVYKADGASAATVTLPAFSARTWRSTDVFGDSAGGGVYVSATGSVTLQPVRAAGTDDVEAGAYDLIAIPSTCRAPELVRIQQGDTVFANVQEASALDGTNAQAEYVFGPVTTTGDDTIEVEAGQLLIYWAGADPQPEPGEQYTVVLSCQQPPVAGVAKLVAPVLGNNAPFTSNQHESVTGYTALPADQVNANDNANDHVFPIVQTNNGWDSVLHLTNFTAGSCSVTVTLYPAGGGLTPVLTQTYWLSKGQTQHVDILDLVGANFIGQAYVSSSCAIGATVDRVKAQQPWGDPVNMALTNQGLAVSSGNTVQALPLVYQGYNGWNTGVSVANLGNSLANVQITFYNQAGTAVGTESLTLNARGMGYVYLPNTTDVGIGGFGQALVQSNQPVLVAVDSVKYSGSGQDVGQALGYVAQRGVSASGELYTPLYQKGLTQAGDHSGIALFNHGPSPAWVATSFRNQAGALIEPTIGKAIVAPIPSFGGYMLYAPSYQQMAPGTLASAVTAVLSGGPVVGVTNNVNYDVQYDGSAAFNLPVADDLFSVSVSCTVVDEPAAGDTTADCTVTAQVPDRAGLPLVFEVVDSADDDSADDDFSFSASSSDDVNTQAATTDKSGTASADLYWVTDDNEDNQFTVTVNVYYDVNGNGQLDTQDVLLGSSTCSNVPPAGAG